MARFGGGGDWLPTPVIRIQDPRVREDSDYEFAHCAVTGIVLKEGHGIPSYAGTIIT